MAARLRAPADRATHLEKSDVPASGNAQRKGEYETRVMEVRMIVEGKVVVLTDVFQGFCPNCGSRVYKAEQLARIEETMKAVPLDGRLNRDSI